MRNSLSSIKTSIMRQETRIVNDPLPFQPSFYQEGSRFSKTFNYPIIQSTIFKESSFLTLANTIQKNSHNICKALLMFLNRLKSSLSYPNQIPKRHLFVYQMQIKRQERTRLRQLAKALDTALHQCKRTHLLDDLQTPAFSPRAPPIFRDHPKVTIRSIGDYFTPIKNSLNFLEELDKREDVSDFDCLMKKTDEQHQYSEEDLKQCFDRTVQHQQFVINQRRKSLAISFIDRPHLQHLENFSVVIQDYQDKGLEFTLKGSKRELVELREGKHVHGNLISNFLKILKLSKKIDDNIQIASLKFLPSIIKTSEGEAIVESKLFRITKSNYDSSIGYLEGPILSKQITVIPFLSEKHYSMLIIKKIDLISLQIIFCSSRFTFNRTLMMTIASYLKVQMEKNPNLPKIFDKRISYFQLILPKQVRPQDSGLYLMLYCETLLTSKAELEKLDLIPNRNKLHLFPRSLALSMRQRVWNLYARLTDPSEGDKGKIIQGYFQERKTFNENAIFKLDYDKIQKKQVLKLFTLASTDSIRQEQQKFALELEYYYNQKVNYYEEQ